jgi:hypothetical protein
MLEILAQTDLAFKEIVNSMLDEGADSAIADLAKLKPVTDKVQMKNALEKLKEKYKN